MSRGEGICCECGYMVRSRMKVVATIFSVVFILSGAVIATGSANPPALPPPQVITITVNQTCITPGGVAEITARALDRNDAPHEWPLRFKIINGPADAELSTVEGAYEDYCVNVTDASGYAHAKLKAGALTGTVEIMVYYLDQTDGVPYVTASNTTDVIIATQCEGPELVVTKVEPNCGFMFANESNIISATIQNSGTEDAGAFNVSFEIAGGAKKEVRIAEGLATNSSVEVTVTDDSVHRAGESVAIRVNADCNAEIQEIDESNNIKEVDETVVNNGYKGKRYTEGASGDISTWRRYAVNGNVIYSTGDSQYLSGSKTPWYDYTVNWSALSVPGTVKEARLYVYYNWDKVQGMPDNVSLKFNGDTITRDAFYTDRKGYDSSNYPYGMLVYNVTTEFNKAGTNTAVLENHYPVAGNPSINGMLLVIVYESETEPQRVILINEGYDLLYGGSSKCTSADEATAFAPFTYVIEDPANVSARLITVAPDASDEGELIFNGHVWHDAWDFSGDSHVGIDDCDVSAYLNTTNEAAFQSSGDYMEASNAILVVKSATEEKYKFTLHLVGGYNLISLPLKDTTVTKASELAAKVGANCTEVVKWDRALQQYVSYVPGVPLNDFDISGGEGYFINTNSPTSVMFSGEGWESPFTISLVEGYNLISLPLKDTTVTKASELAAKVGANCTEVVKWDRALQQYVSYVPGVPLNDFDISGGEGYFINVDSVTSVTFGGEAWQE